jgi:hypothetical protein
MGLEFLHDYGGCRVDPYDPQPSLTDEWPPEGNGEGEETVDLDYERDRDDWQALTPQVPSGWRPQAWPERPIRFIDGKDVGDTVAWVRAPGGQPAPIRLAQIGSIVTRVSDGRCRREFCLVERVVAMVADFFPWNGVEGFAAALQEHGFRFLPAQKPGQQPGQRLNPLACFDFETMRKAAQNRSYDEMGLLEEAALGQDPEVPSVVDGRLEPRAGGFSQTDPVFGVVKTHHKNYLHPRGMQLLYTLEAGQRTPVFRLPHEKLPVVSWYVRLSGGAATPNWGLVRVEAPWRWFEARGKDWDFVDQFSRLLCEYRCRERSYARAAVSLHPIVRAEESLGALFHPRTMLAHRFYRLTHL